MNDAKPGNSDELNLWKHVGIPPLDYCTIERATRILKCEIDDIWHWRDEGYINLYANVHYLDNVVVDSVFNFKDVKNPLIELLLRHPEEVNYVFPPIQFVNLETKYILEDVDGMFPLFSVFKPQDSNYEDVSYPFILTEEGDISVQESIASGLLRLQGNARGHVHPKAPVKPYVRLEGIFDCDMFNLKVKSQKIQLSSISCESLYLIRPDLETLHRAMVLGCFHLDNKSVNTRIEKYNPENSNNNIDMRGRHHAVSREGHILALIYSFINYRGEIFQNGKYTKARHVKVTLDHWSYISPGVKEPSDKHLSGLLRDFWRPAQERRVAKMKEKSRKDDLLSGK